MSRTGACIRLGPEHYAATVSQPHVSDSASQRRAEPLIIAAVAERLEVPLAPARILVEGEVRVELDGASTDRSVLVEAYAHIGALRGSQPRKLASDALKLSWVGARLGASRLIIAVIDADVERYLLRPRAWLSLALADIGVEVLRVDVDRRAREEISSAQRLQQR